MYQVSNAFKLKMIEPIQEHRLTGTIGSISFTEANVVEESFSITNQSTDSNDVKLGSCYVGQLTCEFTGINIAWGKWIGKVITPSFGLYLGNNTWEDVPLGIYTVKEAKHTENGVQVTAYDRMIKFDKKFKKSHFKTLKGMYAIVNQICLDCGMPLGMSQADIQALPNGNDNNIALYGIGTKEYANDITTNRDLLYWCAQTMGCFATINRAGQLVFKQYTQTVVDNISNEHRIDGATFADYITHYIGIYIDNLDTDTYDYYGYDVSALTQEIAETTAEITEDEDRIVELVAELEVWDEKLANHECTQEEYDAAVAEITTELHPLEVETKRLKKRLAWLTDALEHAGDDGADMDLGANPLLMDSNLTRRDNQRKAVLSALNSISYTPFTASVLCGAIYDLGDVIQFSGGLYNSDTDSFGCVMSWNYTHNNGTELEGFGVDPAIVQVRTKAQKSTDRAERNSQEATKNSVGSVDPSDPPTPEDAVTGKSGDMYVQETQKTVKKNVSKTYSCYQTYTSAINNTYHYSYSKLGVTSNSGNFVSTEYKQAQGQATWVVAGSISRPIVRTRFVIKVPKDAAAPMFTPAVTDIEEHNEGDPIGGFGGTGTGTAWSYNPETYRVLNDAGTHYYYYTDCAVGGMTGGLRREVQQADYTFDSYGDWLAAIKADQISIPDVYEGQDGNQVYYNNGSGGNSAWNKVKTVTGVSETDDAGGTDNNGMTIDQATQLISLKKNVVRAWYKADPPQTERKFSQLCVRYTGSPDKAVNIALQDGHGWLNTKITKDDDHVYKVKCHGHYQSGQINYVTYKLTGLTSNKKYYFNFKCNFSDNAQFNYDMTKGCGLVFNTSTTLNNGNYSGEEDTFYPSTGYYAFKRNIDAWYADFGLTASAEVMYMHVLMYAEINPADVTFTISEMVISQKERELIRNIYLYDYTAKEWLKYKPFSGSTAGDDEGGSVVSIDPVYSTGGKLADFAIDGNEGGIYVPIASAFTLGGIKVGDNLNIEEDGTLNAEPGGVSDYDDLTDKPQINGVTISGNKTSAQLGIVITLTQEQYDALTTEQKNDPNKVYYITDAGGSGGGGSVVIVTPILTRGIHIADIKVDDVTYNLYAPQGHVRQISDISSFTKLYATEASFGGSNGAQTNANLAQTNEIAIAISMNNGWNGASAAYYNLENKSGAYAGYSFGQARSIDHVRIYIGRYSNQNKTLTITVQVKRTLNTWEDVCDLEISASIPYPLNYFDVDLREYGDIYGVRWYHYKSPLKSNGNNMSFFGMLLYEYVY